MKMQWNVTFYEMTDLNFFLKNILDNISAQLNKIYTLIKPFMKISCRNVTYHIFNIWEDSLQIVAAVSWKCGLFFILNTFFTKSLEAKDPSSRDQWKALKTHCTG